LSQCRDLTDDLEFFIFTARQRLFDHAPHAEMLLERIVKGDGAAGADERRPEIKIAPCRRIGMIAVDPEKRDRLAPAPGHLLRLQMDEPDVLGHLCAEEVFVQRDAIFGTIFASRAADKRKVWIDRIDANVVPRGFDAMAKRDRGCAKTGSDLD